MMSTYTFAIMHVSEQTYEEIKRKMIEAGYDYVFHQHPDGPVIGIVGIGIQADPKQQPPQLTAADLNLRSPHEQKDQIFIDGEFDPNSYEARVRKSKGKRK